MTYDIVIVGSGIVGATAALSLAQKTKVRIAILEEKNISFDWSSEQHDYRVSAISLTSKTIFKNVKVWNSISQKRISPYENMHVWDDQHEADIQFNCRELNEPALGYIIEDNVMRSSLLSQLRECENVTLIYPSKLISIEENVDAIKLILENQIISTKLLIAADGANSSVRQLLNFELTSKDYGHTAIVATLQTELAHERTARQRFITSGPLAFLPLTNPHQSSIVWSTAHQHAKELLALSDEAFCETLTNAFQNKMGNIQKISTRYHFPLTMRHVKNYVRARVALIGDAAHTIHPLAGQGVNLGLLDAIYLVDVIVESLKKQRDFASFHTLRRYERWRKSENSFMLAGIEVLKQLFASENNLVKQIRNSGLRFSDRNAWVKKFFANYVGT
jgi:2-octaprenylphenol hydroxylase